MSVFHAALGMKIKANPQLPWLTNQTGLDVSVTFLKHSLACYLTLCGCVFLLETWPSRRNCTSR